MIYKIQDWGYHYENSRSRSIAHCNWCPIPNKQDGLGYKRLVATSGNGAAHYGVWMAIVLLASKQRSPRQGYLTVNGKSDGKPLTIEDLHLTTGLPKKIISEAFPRFVEVGWLEAIGSIRDDTPLPQGESERQHVATFQNNRKERKEDKSAISTAQVYVTFKKRQMNSAHLEAFDQFWRAFKYKKDRSRAADAWLDIDWPTDSEGKNALFAKIITAAKAEALDRPYLLEQRKTPIYAEGWLAHRRWEDE